MPQTVKGVVAMEQDAPVTIENIVIPDPGPGEAVVAIQACGVCHTDLHYREGAINDDFRHSRELRLDHTPSPSLLSWLWYSLRYWM